MSISVKFPCWRYIPVSYGSDFPVKGSGNGSQRKTNAAMWEATKYRKPKYVHYSFYRKPYQPLFYPWVIAALMELKYSLYFSGRYIGGPSAIPVGEMNNRNRLPHGCSDHRCVRRTNITSLYGTPPPWRWTQINRDDIRHWNREPLEDRRQLRSRAINSDHILYLTT